MIKLKSLIFCCFILGIHSQSLADKGCSQETKREVAAYASKVVSALPKIDEDMARTGTFVVKNDINSGKMLVSYSVQGKKVFSVDAPHPDQKSELYYCATSGRPSNMQGRKSLTISFGCGSKAMSLGCGVNIYASKTSSGKYEWLSNVVDDR